jgi:EmrB/QacA subfamily drug resistance transporter
VSAANSPSTRRWPVVSLAFATLLPALGTSSANVGLPALAAAFDAPFADVQWVVLAYLLSITVLVVGAGRLGDMIGRRKVLLGGVALFTLASALCGLAPDLYLLITARALQGAGAAIMMALAMAMMSGQAAGGRVGSAMGLLGTMSAVGTALGPSLGGLLLAGLGWRAIFLVNVPLGLATLWLALRHLPAEQPGGASKAGLDIAGTLLLALTLAAYALVMTVGPGSTVLINLALFAVAGGGLVAFLLVEARVRNPLIRPGMLRDRPLASGLASNGLVAAVMMATLVVGPFYLALGLGLDAVMVGLVMSAGPAVSALAGVPSGRLVDRFGPRPMTLVGLVAIGAACLLLAGLPATLGVAGYVMPLMLATSGYALFQAANNTAVMGKVEPERRGLVSGILNLSRNLGLITGTAALGAVFSAVAGPAELAQASDVVAGMRSTFAVAASLILAAMALAVTGQRRLSASPEPEQPA